MIKKAVENLRIIFLLILLAAVILIWHSVFYFEEHQNLVVTFFDVGQGDAAFIEIPGGNQILIDGGPSRQILSKLGRALPFWDRSIDLLILTHPHADHLDGLLEVLKRYKVDLVLESGVEHSIPEYQEWRELLKTKKNPVVIARFGQKINLGHGARLDIFHPFENFTSASVKNVHDANIVSRLRYGRNSILFMGDAEKMIEYRLLFESLDSGSHILNSDILKVGHHGSKTSSPEEFLQAVSPETAIIQVGRKNKYGHPAQEVLDRLSVAGAKVFRNDLNGDIKIESDRNNYVVSD